ncbi:hypothetical protein J1N35_035446 [Gossypium stocksii]|uniref:Uncharacterized protein n=1 Tax=Gossypium stocksii TaxID=47602 RepID=A0A9D3ZQ60_9ROSI|nr:hypothetical protein J1N35_035446 [Gossypium stocksii]
MSEHISAVIYNDSEVRDIKNVIVFLSENTTRIVFNQTINLTEFRKRIRRKIFKTMLMRFSSIKYRFCASIDPVTYDLFDIKGGRSFEVMVQTHLASGSPYLELYIQFSSPNKIFKTSTSTVIREEDTTLTRHSISGRQNMEAFVFGGSMEYTTPARHSVSGWDMYICGSMFNAKNMYWGMASTSSGRQSISNWGR